MEPGKDNAGDFCDPGFYCKEGSRTATPLDGITGTMLNYQLFFVWLCHVPFENSYMAEPNKEAEFPISMNILESLPL